MLRRTELIQLARAGAEARIDELNREIASIYASFPDLRRRPSTSLGTALRLSKAASMSPRSASASTAAAASPESTTQGRRKWTAAQRKAAADRMRKYWAARKNGKK